MTPFAQRYFSEPCRLPPAAQRAFELWVEFYRKTEEHDQAVCMMRNARGEAIPTTKRERMLCTHNAIERKRELRRAAADAGVDSETLESVRKEALNYFYTQRRIS